MWFIPSRGGVVYVFIVGLHRWRLVIACVHVTSVSFAAHRRRLRAGLLGQGKKKKTTTLFNCLPATRQDVTLRPGKPRTLDISQECLLGYDQSQQISGHVNWPQNHKQINVLVCGLVFSRLIGFFLEQNNIPEIFLVFTVFPVWL